MDVKEELLYDYSIKMPRLLVSGKTAILDHVRKIVYITEQSVVVDHGNRFSEVSGIHLRVLLIEEERVIVTGEIAEVKFYSGKDGELNEK